MAIKIKNSNGEWVVDQKAIETSIIDLNSNFESNNVEGALRELAENQINNEEITSLSTRMNTAEEEIESLSTRMNTTNEEITSLSTRMNTTNEEITSLSTRMNTAEEEIVLLSENQVSNEEIASLSARMNTAEEDIAWLKENGGGGGGTAVPIITSTFVDTNIEKGEDVTIPIFFSSSNIGNGIAYILVNNVQVDFIGVLQGNNNIKIKAKYLTETNNLVGIYVKDGEGIASNQLSWTIISDGIELTTTFNYEKDYGVNDTIRIPYSISIGITSGEIVLYLSIDDKVTRHISKVGYNYLDIIASDLGLGVHKVSMYATLGSYTSSVIAFNLAIVPTNELTLSSTFINGQIFDYGEPIQINYRLSKTTTEEYTIYLKIDGVISETQKVTVGNYYWTIQNLSVGRHTVTIQAVSLDSTEDKSLALELEVVRGEYVGIYKIETRISDYTFSFASDGLLDDGNINWGDGTITKGEYSHTYANPGIYIIKGKVHSTASTPTDSMKLSLKEIIQYPTLGNLYYAFKDCILLVSANISGNKYYDSNQSRACVFQNCISLETVIASDTKLEQQISHSSAFQGCEKLREVTGIGDFIYNTQNISNLFDGCLSLSNLTIPIDSLRNCTSAISSFYNCALLTDLPIKTLNIQNISRIFEGCTNITDINDITFGENITSADEWQPPRLTTINNVTINNGNNVINFRNCTHLRRCNNLILSNNVTNISGLFSGCHSLRQDVIIPSHITNCSEMFKNCTSMTHIHSNWENVYDADISSTDCYTGCTAIAYIDDKNVKAYPGDKGLDNLPLEWGGNGLFNDGTISVIELTVPCDDFEFKLFLCCDSFSRRNGEDATGDNFISWGDGQSFSTSTTIKGNADFPTHTYAKAGVYYIKGHFGRFSRNPSANNGMDDPFPYYNTNYVTGIARWATRVYDSSGVYYNQNNQKGCFKDFAYLEYAKNLQFGNTVQNLDELFSGCTSLTSVDFNGCDTSNVTTMEYMFFRCKALVTLDITMLRFDKTLSICSMFEECNKLSNLIVKGLTFPALDASSSKSSENLFAGCTSLTSNPYVDFGNLDNFSSINLRRCWELTVLDFKDIPLKNVESIVLPDEVTEVKGLNLFKPCDIDFRSLILLTKVNEMWYNTKLTYTYWYGYDRDISSPFETTFVGEIERIPKNEPQYVNCYLNGLALMSEASKTSFVNALKDYTGQDRATLYGARQYLSSEQISIATSKNWSVTT